MVAKCKMINLMLQNETGKSKSLGNLMNEKRGREFSSCREVENVMKRSPHKAELVPASLACVGVYCSDK